MSRKKEMYGLFIKSGKTYQLYAKYLSMTFGRAI